MTVKVRRVALEAARQRLDSLLRDPKVGAGRELPDETLDLVTKCLDAISEVVERRRSLDTQQRTQSAVQQPAPPTSH